MIKEKYTINSEETSLNLVQTQIESVRKKNITKTGFRLYKDNKIGVSGAIGKYNEKEQWEKSEKALSLNIDYPYEVSGSLEKTVQKPCDFSDGVAFTEEMEELLKELRQRHPKFIFSNKINLVTDDVSLKNDNGLNLQSRISKIEASVLIKDKSSSDLMDAFMGMEGTQWDREEFLRMVNMTCKGLEKNADIENGRHKVVIIPYGCEFMGKMYSELHGLKYGTGGSLFSGRIDEKLFSENFTLYQTLSPVDGVLEPFFDTEGTINDDFIYPLIENGVLKTPYTDKKYASQFNLPLTGAAGGSYDSVPSLSPHPLVIKNSEKTLKELLGGEKAILVLFASGGDFTPDGKYATPVQTSFLFDGEKMLGRLPQLNITSHIYDMFGKDFVGVAKDSFTSLFPMHLPVMNLKVEKI
ncbi:MAG: metallopeptidase TldD-related protein [Thermotogota bacterium]|nr:metallopeptidase TldD-related protein [Thermotogota bacterium]